MKSALTYEYSTAKVSHFVLKRPETICRNNSRNRNTLVGVFCKACDHYISTRDGYVLCANKAHKKDDDGPNVGRVRKEIIDGLIDRAFKALDYM